MKKVTLWISLLAASMLAGAVTAFTVTRLGNSHEKVYSTVPFASNVGTHFTSFSADSYPDLTYAAENAVKGVVNIEVRQEVRRSTGSSSRSFDPLLEFFGIPQGDYQPQQQPQQRVGGGSGVIISPDGYIVTNNHVIANASEIKVTLEDGQTYEAKLIGTDATTDVALIKVEADNLPTIPFGDSDALRLGEWVLAIGSPYGLQNTVTAGIISAKARSLGAIPDQFRIESFIQTDAAVNPGNSGGALVNTRGELVGINTVIKSPTGSFTGYSFAVPSALVRKVVMDLREYGVVQRAMLGVTIQEVNSDFIEERGKETGITEKGGVYVEDLDPEGAAYPAGIKKGDVITQIDGVKTDRTASLIEEVARRRPNDKITVMVKRNGQVKQFEVVLRNKAGNTDVVKKEIVSAYEALGGQFGEISDKTKKSLKIDGGVQVTSMTEDGLLAKSRVRRGYIITHINEREVNSINDLNRINAPIVSIDGIYPDGRSASYNIVSGK